MTRIGRDSAGSIDPAELVLGCVQRFAERPFLIDAQSGLVFTFGTCHELACNLSMVLYEHGVGKGDRVALVLPNCVEFALLYFACLYLGAVAVPINPHLPKKDIALILKISCPKVVIGSGSTMALAELDGCDGRGQGGIYLAATGTGSGSEREPHYWSVEAPRERRPSGWKPFDGVANDDLFTIIFTSGTTGLPKGVPHRIGSLMGAAVLFNRELGFSPTSRFYHVLPMAYMAGFLNTLLCPFLAGSSVVIGRSFDARTAIDFWDAAIRYEVNTLWMVPTIIAVLVNLDRGRNGREYCRKHVETVCVGTAPFPLKLKRDFEDKYEVETLESYGLSETLFVTASSKSGSRLPGSVGHPLPGVSVRIVNESGTDASFGEDGEVWIRTPFLMAGYLDHETGVPGTASASDWFASGDLGHITPSGHLFITGRKKDVIIRGGVNISPRAIEDVLQHHPSIAQVAVVGLPHELYGEEVIAAVKLEEGYRLETVRPVLEQLCRDSLPTFSVPARFVEVEEFPTSATGKLQKAALKERLSASLS